MHLLYCDETNLVERKGDFFVYGGLCIASDQAAELSRRIDKLRAEAKVPPLFELKFLPPPS
jgi:hypothetical protein